MSEDFTTPATPAPDAPATNSFARIAGVLFAPAKTFAEIARRPDIAVPLIVILLIGYVTTAIVLPRTDFGPLMEQQASQARKQNPNMSEADVERAGRMVQGLARIAAWTGPLITVAWYAIVAGVLLLAFRLMGGEGNYKQAFSATLYAWMPLVLFGIVSTVVIVARGTFDPSQAATLVKSNPAFLVDMKEQPLLFSLLSSFDVFTIWTLILTTFGFAALSRFSRSKSAVIVAVLWGVSIVIKIGFAAMQAMMSGDA